MWGEGFTQSLLDRQEGEGGGTSRKAACGGQQTAQPLPGYAPRRTDVLLEVWGGMKIKEGHEEERGGAPPIQAIPWCPDVLLDVDELSDNHSSRRTCI